MGTWGKKGLKASEKIAGKLGISLKIVDARKEFKRRITDYFISAYEKGLTPNPCVMCNREIKFRLLLKLLKKEKADYVATGHYARVKVRPLSPRRNVGVPQGRTLYGLREAKDKTKDQSYFLYRLTQKDLSRIVFPVGDYRKTDVKKMAKKMNLPVAAEESQDVCFLAEKDMNDFLKKYIKPKPGDIVDGKGNKLAKHKGLPFYTIGQRKGIEIGGTGPYYVAGKNAGKNELTVTKNPRDLLTKTFQIENVSWIGGGAEFPLRAEVKIRYQAPSIPAIIRKGKRGKYIVEAKKSLRAATPGQSAVFYKSGEVLGGGLII